MANSGADTTLTWQDQPIHTSNTNDPISFTAFLSERKSRGQQYLLPNSTMALFMVATIYIRLVTTLSLTKLS